MYAMQDMLFAGAGARAAVPFTGLMGCIFRYVPAFSEGHDALQGFSGLSQ